MTTRGSIYARDFMASNDAAERLRTATKYSPLMTTGLVKVDAEVMGFLIRALRLWLQYTLPAMRLPTPRTNGIRKRPGRATLAAAH